MFSLKFDPDSGPPPADPDPMLPPGDGAELWGLPGGGPAPTGGGGNPGGGGPPPAEAAEEGGWGGPGGIGAPPPLGLTGPVDGVWRPPSDLSDDWDRVDC